MDVKKKKKEFHATAQLHIHADPVAVTMPQASALISKGPTERVWYQLTTLQTWRLGGYWHTLHYSTQYPGFLAGAQTGGCILLWCMQ